MFAMRLLARVLRGTNLVDRAYRRFSRLRSRLVLASASDRFYDLYNDVCYSAQRRYRAGSECYRSGFFPWEERVIDRVFPSPPALILVGAAGGGREALALADRGYRVVAFDPAPILAASMTRAKVSAGSVEVLVGRYEELPYLATLDDLTTRIDVRRYGPFGGVLLGWASFSHLRSDKQCVETLRQARELTAGPIFISYLSQLAGRSGSESRNEFSIDIGYYRPLSEGRVALLADEAGLRIVEEDHYNGWSVLVRT